MVVVVVVVVVAGGTVYCGLEIAGPLGPFAQGAARPQYENSSRAKRNGWSSPTRQSVRNSIKQRA